MEEVQFVGEKKFVYQLNADKYFELLKIQEMLNLEGDMYLPSNETEYENLKFSYFLSTNELPFNTFIILRNSAGKSASMVTFSSEIG